MAILSELDVADNDLDSEVIYKNDEKFAATLLFNYTLDLNKKDVNQDIAVNGEPNDVKDDKGNEQDDIKVNEEPKHRYSYEDEQLRVNILSDAESKLFSTRSSDEITFLNKNIVSEYETETQVEYKVNTWEELSSSLDLSWVEKKKYKCLQSLNEFKAILPLLKRAEYIAVDTETTGLNIFNLTDNNPVKDKIVGMSLTWEKDQGIYIPFRHKKFNNLPLDIVMKVLKPILENKKMIAHNAIFDYRVFYDLGIDLNVFMDTMVLLFHIDSTVAKGGKGLKENIKKIFGIDTLDLETMTGQGRYAAKFDVLDFKTCQAYGCADTDFAFQLFVYLMPFLDKRQYAGLRQDIELIRPLSIMEYYGRRVDMKQLPVYNEINDKDIFTLMDLCFKYVGTYLNLKEGKAEVSRYLFNFNSSDELSRVLYDILDIEPIAFSEKTGKPKTNSTVIKTYLSQPADEPDEVLGMIMDGDVKSSLWDYDMFYDSDGNLIDCEGDEYLIKWKKISITKHPIIYLIKQLRGLIKLKTSFFIKLMNDNYEGKYFTSVSLTAAETYRIIDPIQTIPAYLKKLFIAYEDNHTCMDSDYSQVEARVFTSLAQDTELIKKLNRPWADYHREGGAFIFGIKPEDITKEQRSSLKVVNFGLPFKMGPKGLVGFKYGIIADKEEEKKAIIEMTELSDKWKKANWRVQDMLDSFRAEAVKVCKEPKVKAYFGNRLVSKIYNHAGRARVFDLEGVVDEEGNIIDKSKAERIYRQAGNFPIQGYARHLFGQGLVKLWNDFRKDNLVMIKVPDDSKPLGYRFDTKIYLMATVHDEILLSISNEINPYYILDELEKCMMAKIEGHTNYYMGVSYCYNWHDGHSGRYEMSAGCMLSVLSKLRSKGEIPIMCRGQELEGKDYVRELDRINKEFSLQEEVEEFERLSSIGSGDISLDNFNSDFVNYELKGFAKDLSVDESKYNKILTEIKEQTQKDLDSYGIDIFIKMFLNYFDRVVNPIRNFNLKIGSDLVKVRV